MSQSPGAGASLWLHPSVTRRPSVTRPVAVSGASGTSAPRALVGAISPVRPLRRAPNVPETVKAPEPTPLHTQQSLCGFFQN